MHCAEDVGSCRDTWLFGLLFSLCPVCFPVHTTSVANNGTALVQLRPPSKSPLLSHHLLSLAAQYPLHTFHRDLMNFLIALHAEIPSPALEQCFGGQCEDMSIDQLQGLLRSAQVVL